MEEFFDNAKEYKIGMWTAPVVLSACGVVCKKASSRINVKRNRTKILGDLNAVFQELVNEEGKRWYYNKMK